MLESLRQADIGADLEKIVNDYLALPDRPRSPSAPCGLNRFIELPLIKRILADLKLSSIVSC